MIRGHNKAEGKFLKDLKVAPPWSPGHLEGWGRHCALSGTRRMTFGARTSRYALAAVAGGAGASSASRRGRCQQTDRIRSCLIHPLIERSEAVSGLIDLLVNSAAWTLQRLHLIHSRG